MTSAPAPLDPGNPEDLREVDKFLGRFYASIGIASSSAGSVCKQLRSVADRLDREQREAERDADRERAEEYANGFEDATPDDRRGLRQGYLAGIRAERARQEAGQCGVAITADGSPAQLHAAHVAAVVASSADLAVISLPDSDEHNFAAEVKPGELVWCRYIDRTDSVASVIMRADGAIQAYMSGVRNPDEAEWAAGALLAAAKAAEGVSRDGE